MAGMSVNPIHLTPPQKVSAALLRDELMNSAAAVRTAEVRLSEARAERDSLIREASSLISMMKLARIVGLSRDRLYKIVYSGSPTETPAPEDV